MAKLGIKKLAILEFGVFHGVGLLSFCRICDIIHQPNDMAFEIYGFDTPAGWHDPIYARQVLDSL